MSGKLLIAITGPTASGKSALSIEIARRLQTEIVSADSRQIYRHIPVMTAVPTIEERQGIRHHLIEELELDQYFSASMFEQVALRRLEDIFREKDVAVLCGGSMMYVDALCHGIDDIPTVPEDIRRAVAGQYAERGIEELLEELRLRDPVCFAKIDRQNHKRVMHAVEICRASGVPYSSLLGKEKAPRPFRVAKFELTLPRPLLFERINRRVEAMMEAGGLDEARKVYPLRGLNSLNTVGFKELFACFDGEMTLPEAISRIQKNTRVYAKKQITWFKRDPSIESVDVQSPEAALNQILSAIS